MIMEISSDKRIYAVRNTPRVVIKWICPDEKATHEFLFQAFDFNVVNGLNISVRMSNALSNLDCNTINIRVTKTVSFLDIKTRNQIIEH